LSNAAASNHEFNVNSDKEDDTIDQDTGKLLMNKLEKSTLEDNHYGKGNS